MSCARRFVLALLFASMLLIAGFPQLVSLNPPKSAAISHVSSLTTLLSQALARSAASSPSKPRVGLKLPELKRPDLHDLSLLKEREHPEPKAPGKRLNLRDPPLASSLADVVISGQETWQNQVVVIEGNLIIEPGGNLTLVNTTLYMKCNSSGEYQIRVRGGGSLVVASASNLTAWDPANPFLFVVEPNASLVMCDSELHCCGYSEDYPGLLVRTDDAYFENCIFTRNFHALSVVGGSAFLEGCAMSENYRGLYCEGDSSVVVSSCSLVNNWWEGVRAWDSSVSLVGCDISLNGDDGIRCDGCTLYMVDCTVRENHGDGLDLMASGPAEIRSSAICNNTGWGVCCDLSNASLYDCEVAWNWLDGIEAFGGSSVSAEGCEICFNGLDLFWCGVHSMSSRVELRECNISFNGNDGLYLEDSDAIVESCFFKKNYRFGVYSLRCSDLAIAGNEFRCDGVLFEGEELAHFLHQVEDNTLNGKPLLYLVNATGVTVSEDFGSAIVVNSEGVTIYSGSLVDKLLVSYADMGIEVAYSSSVTVKSCVVELNDWYGMYFYESQVEVSDCYIGGNGIGVYCSGSSDVDIEHCNICANLGVGLYSASSEVTVDATCNWWESPEGPEESEVGDPDPPEEVWGDVAYDPWLAVPTCWADFDEDDVPNFLDNPAFNVYVLLRPGTVEMLGSGGTGTHSFSWPVGIYIVTPATSMSDMLSVLQEWGVDCDPNASFALPIVIDVVPEGIFGVLANFIALPVVWWANNYTLCQDQHLRLLLFPIIRREGFGLDEAMRLLILVKRLLTGSAISDLVAEELLELLDRYDADFVVYFLFEYPTYLGRSVWAYDIRELIELIRDLSGLAEAMMQISLEVMEGLLTGTIFTMAFDLAMKVLNFVIELLDEWIPEVIEELLEMVEIILSIKDPPGVGMHVEVYKCWPELNMSDLIFATGLFNYSEYGIMSQDPDKYIILVSKDAFPLSFNITAISAKALSSEPQEVNYTLVIRDLEYGRAFVCVGTLATG